MRIYSVFQATLLSLFILFSATSYAADPTMQQVYETAKAGKMDEAQTMIQQVLQNHPDSAKAHFVAAELLAKQGRFASAQAELNNADRLAPGLPFAKPEAVENLRRLISTAQKRPSMNKPVNTAQTSPANSSPPWGLIIVGLGLIGFIVFAVKFMANRNQNPNPQYYPTNGATGSGSSSPMPSYGSPGGMGMPSAGGSIGSGIVGGLVTGAALGAGMVAGQELMHRFTDGDKHNNASSTPDNNNYLPPNDMGGNDFGISDNSSWDSFSGGDSSGGGDW